MEQEEKAVVEVHVMVRSWQTARSSTGAGALWWDVGACTFSSRTHCLAKDHSV